ncbi:MAG: methylated-DNA--[protein]-cysteine S-methyltransferase [Geobacteraceae bacterium]|jgi:methylated-DNA-[protein]-cysteine S-methyltransferase
MKIKRNAAPARYCSLFGTDLGFGGVVAGEEGLIEVCLPFAGENEAGMAARIALLYPSVAGENQVTREAALLLKRYFAGERISFDLPVDRSGFTPFQSAVYEEVARIPYGMVRSYGEVAAQIGRNRAARGVGSAMARNPLPVIIPCHRVVGASGELTGYSAPGGVMSKQWLLRMEGVSMPGEKR